MKSKKKKKQVEEILKNVEFRVEATNWRTGEYFSRDVTIPNHLINQITEQICRKFGITISKDGKK